MKKYFAENWWYVLLFVVVLCNCVATCVLFDSHFYTKCDEAYCLLGHRDAYDQICVGIPQWALIAIKWFPYFDLTGKIAACWAAFILMIATAANAILSAYLLTRKQSIIRYIVIFLPALLLVIGGCYASEEQTYIGWVNVINYVVMQVFLLGSSIAALMLFYYHQNKWIRYTALLCAGIFVGISLFVIPPSGILFLISYWVLILVKTWRNRKDMLCGITMYGLGLCLSLLYMHLCVFPLPAIISEMKQSIIYTMDMGKGYTPIEMLLEIGKIGVDFLIYFAMAIGCYVVAHLIGKQKRLFGGTIYMLYACACMYWIYKLNGFIAIVPFIAGSSMIALFHIIRERKDISLPDYFIYLFLFFAPMICAIGTNTNLWGRMGCFMISWGFLFILTSDVYKVKMEKCVLGVALLFIVMAVTYNNARTYHHHHKYYTERFTSGNQGLADVYVTSAQKDFFETIQSIVAQYQFRPRQSVMFASCINQCVVYALDAEPSTRYYLHPNFQVLPKYPMTCPDFLVLTETEKSLGLLSDLDWGWPEEFDEYELKTPETICQKFTERNDKKRILYCRKSLKFSE